MCQLSVIQRVVCCLLLLAPPAWGVPEEADLVLRGGAVYRMDAPRTWVQAIAIKGGRISYVGSTEGVAPYLGNSTRCVELKGRMVLPGFCDSHVHPLLAGLEAMHCQLTADLVVLSHNLFEVPLTKIHEVKVELTILGGRATYDLQQAATP